MWLGVWGRTSYSHSHTLPQHAAIAGRRQAGTQQSVAHQLWGERERLSCCGAFSSVVERENITTALPSQHTTPSPQHSHDRTLVPQGPIPWQPGVTFTIVSVVVREKREAETSKGR